MPGSLTSPNRFTCSRPFPRPIIFVGGVLFGLGNGACQWLCLAGLLILLGKVNSRSLVVVIAIIADLCQMTLRVLLAPLRLAALQWSQVTPRAVYAPALMSSMGIDDFIARFAVMVVLLSRCSSSHSPTVRSAKVIRRWRPAWPLAAW